jgi:hypothetical protein
MAIYKAEMNKILGNLFGLNLSFAQKLRFKMNQYIWTQNIDLKMQEWPILKILHIWPFSPWSLLVANQRLDSSLNLPKRNVLDFAGGSHCIYSVYKPLFD